MDLLKEFCNICYTKRSESPIKNIGVEDGGHKKQILITLFGNTSIFNSYEIFLCVNCCEYLENFDKFRETCFKNFILFRQLFFDMKSQLECTKDENAEIKLKQFLIEKVFNGYDEEINKKYLDTKETNNIEKTNNIQAIERTAQTDIKQEEDLTQDMKNEYSTRSEICINSDDEFHSDFDSDEDDAEIKIEPKVECKQETLENSMQIEISVVENHEDYLSSEEDADIEDSEDDVHESDVEMDEPTYSEIATETEIIDEFENSENVLHESVPVGSSSENMVQSFATNSSSRSDRPLQKSEPNKLKYDTFEGPPCSLDVRFKCKKCDKVLQSNSHLIDHQRIHTGDRPFKCDVCQKTFNIQSNLTVHKRIHTGIRPYKCKECDKSFIQLCSLNIHSRVHSGLKPFKCTKCEKAYRTSSSLRKHKFAYHKN